MNNLDPVNVAIAVASLLFAPALANVLGPYALIVLASSVGASWALGRKDGPSVPLPQHESLSEWARRSLRTGVDAFFFFARLVMTAMLITVGIADLVGKWLGHQDSTWLLTPIALLVGGVGDDWPKVGRWAAGLLGDFAGNWFKRKGGGE